MARRYRIRVYGKARENPDPAMLAQIVILIGRRLHAEHRTTHTTGGVDDVADSPHGNARYDSSEPGCEASRSDE
jgi:hypothetical protein